MKKAFTMIELIFVIVILGIISSIAVPKLAATREDAQVVKISSDIKTLQKDIDTYFAVNGEIPTHFDFRKITNVPLKFDGKNALYTNNGSCIRIIADNVNLVTFYNNIPHMSEICKKVLFKGGILKGYDRAKFDINNPENKNNNFVTVVDFKDVSYFSGTHKGIVKYYE